MIIPQRDLKQALKGYDAVKVSLHSDVKDTVELTLNNGEVNITAKGVELTVVADVEGFKEPILIDRSTLDVLKKVSTTENLVISEEEITIGNMTIIHQGEIKRPELNKDEGYTLVGTFLPDEIKNAIKMVKHAVCKEEARPILQNILWEGSDIVSVDGYRVSLAALEKDLSEPVLLNKTAYVVVEKMLGKSEPVFVYTNGDKLKIEHDDWTLFVDMPSGEFLKYKQIFSDEHELQFTVDRKEWISKLELAMLAVGKKNPIKLTLNEGMTISANTQGLEYSGIVDSFEWKIKQKLEIAFNPKYIIEALKSMADKVVTVTMISSLTPMIIHHSKGKELVLPVRLNQ